MKNKELEQWALPILKKYQAVLLLQDHLLTFEYKQQARMASSDSLFEHGFNYPYKNTAIYFGENALEKWKKKTKESKTEMYNGLIHELCHSLTDPLYSAGYDRFITHDTLKNERERLTDHIANIIVKIYE